MADDRKTTHHSQVFLFVFGSHKEKKQTDESTCACLSQAEAMHAVALFKKHQKVHACSGNVEETE